MRFASFALLLLLAGCAKDDDKKVEPIDTDPSPLSDATGSGNIYFDGALSRKERGAFVAALGYLDQTGMSHDDGSLSRLLGIADDNASIHRWLEDRVQYIVSDSTNDSKLSRVGLGDFRYPNPGILGSADGPAAREESAKTIMLNIGAALYDVGKQGSFLWQVDEDGLGPRLIKSPRAGILQIGEGLFMFPADKFAFVKIFHLGTLLHEARHSDGNGKTTGFFHSICTSDDPGMVHYKGKAACDHSTNGPYTVGAFATDGLRESCTDCSIQESNALYQLYLDYKSRVIFDNATSAWDASPEGQR